MKAMTIKQSMFEVQMCVPKEMSAAEVLAQAKRENAGQWRVKDLGDHTWVQCEDDSRCHHVVLSSVVSA